MSNTAVAMQSALASASGECGRIYAADGVICVEGYAGLPVAVYGIDGREVFVSSSAGMRQNVAVPAGIYVVKASGDVKKVLVK